MKYSRLKKKCFDLPLKIIFCLLWICQIKNVRILLPTVCWNSLTEKNFECLECDTDSLYIAISGKSLQEVIKEDKKKKKKNNLIRIIINGFPQLLVNSTDKNLLLKIKTLNQKTVI